MKQPLYLSLFTLPLLLALTGCGGGGTSSAKLEVSNSFVTTNTKFGGGLIVSGRTLSGSDSFSVSLTTGMTTTLDLTKGNWIITAIGWDGGALPEKPFAGKPYCGHVTATLIKDTETINLSVTEEACANNMFSGGHVDTSSTPHTLRKLARITTCNSFYTSVPKPTDAVASLLVNDNTTSSYCYNLGEDVHGDVRGIRIRTIEKDPGKLTSSRTALSSGCLASGTAPNVTNFDPYQIGNPYNGKELRLPYNSVPLIIETFRDASCTDPLANYRFTKGLKDGNPEAFDHKLTNTNSPTDQVKLHLPGNDLRRAISPFVALMPYFKNYNAGTPKKIPTTLTSPTFDFHGYTGQPTTVTIPDKSTCNTPSFSGISGSCNVVDGKTQVTFSGAGGGGDLTGNFTVNSITYNVYLADNIMSELRHRSQGLLIEYFGHPLPFSRRSFFQEYGRNHSDDEKVYGVLSEPRSMFSANGAGGVMGLPSMMGSAGTTFADVCLATQGEKEITIYDHKELRFDRHKVVVHDAPTSAPNSFFCNIADPNDTNCTSSYDKRMKIYDYKVSTFVPVMTFEFSCDKLIGRMESHDLDIKDGWKEEFQEIISWNTEPGTSLDMQRFERLGMGTEYKWVNNAWSIDSQHRTMMRAMKTGPDEYETWDYSYGTRWSNTNFEQNLNKFQIKSSGGYACVLNEKAFDTAAEHDSILTDTADATLAALRTSTAYAGTAPANSYIYDPTSSWANSNVSVCSGLVFSDLTSLGADNLNGNLPFKFDSLNSNNFTNAFGTSFFTAP